MSSVRTFTRWEMREAWLRMVAGENLNRAGGRAMLQAARYYDSDTASENDANARVISHYGLGSQSVQMRIGEYVKTVTRGVGMSADIRGQRRA